jgi:hypothetical protein
LEKQMDAYFGRESEGAKSGLDAELDSYFGKEESKPQGEGKKAKNSKAAPASAEDLDKELEAFQAQRASAAEA